MLGKIPLTDITALKEQNNLIYWESTKLIGQALRAEKKDGKDDNSPILAMEQIYVRN